MPRKDSSRSRILNSANTLFHQHGYDVITVDEICDHSHSAKGSFYHFFASKEDLAVQLLDDLWDSTQEVMKKTFSADKPPLEQIRDELHRVYTASRTSRERTGQVNGCPIGFLSTTLGARSEKTRKRTAFLYNHMRQFYLTAFRQAQAAGDLPAKPDADELADTMLAVIQGIHLLGRTHNSPTRVRRLVNSAFNVLVANN